MDPRIRFGAVSDSFLSSANDTLVKTVIPGVALVAILFNALTCCVFWRLRNVTPGFVYLLFGAVADLVTLISIGSTCCLENWNMNPQNSSEIICKGSSWIIETCAVFGIYQQLLLTYKRYKTVHSALVTQRGDNARQSIKYSLLNFLVCWAISFLPALLSNINDETDKCGVSFATGYFGVVQKVYVFLCAAVMAFLAPIIALGFMGASIIRKARERIRIMEWMRVQATESELAESRFSVGTIASSCCTYSLLFFAVILASFSIIIAAEGDPKLVTFTQSLAILFLLLSMMFGFLLCLAGAKNYRTEAIALLKYASLITVTQKVIRRKYHKHKQGNEAQITEAADDSSGSGSIDVPPNSYDSPGSNDSRDSNESPGSNDSPNTDETRGSKQSSESGFYQRSQSCSSGGSGSKGHKSSGGEGSTEDSNESLRSAMMYDSNESRLKMSSGQHSRKSSSSNGDNSSNLALKSCGEHCNSKSTGSKSTADIADYHEDEATRCLVTQNSRETEIEISPPRRKRKLPAIQMKLKFRPFYNG